MIHRRIAFTLVELPVVSKRESSAFTLVELLIVVAVIAILVSILLPALRKARYQTKLVVCASRLHQNGLALISYSVANRGRFPQRWDFTPAIGTSAPFRIAQLGPSEQNDLRPFFAPYTTINGTFRCPLAPAKVDIELVAARIEINCAYDIWLNWPPPSSPISPSITHAMQGPDDDMIATDTLGGEYHFKVMMDDFARDSPSSNSIETVHPDYPRSLQSKVVDGEFMGSNQQVLAYYWGKESTRKQLDRNFLFTDGHVRTIAQIQRQDARLVRIWNFWGLTEVQLPPNE